MRLNSKENKAGKLKFPRIICITLLLLSLFFLYGYNKKEKASSSLSNYKDYNVILISLGPLRADHLGCYGHFRNTSPNIDKLAKKAIVFKNVHSQSSLTLPSQMSLNTSLYPYEHKIYLPLEAINLDKEFLTLAQILKKHNYATVWIGGLDNPWLGLARGMDRGFDKFYSYTDFSSFSIHLDRNDFYWKKAFAWIRDKNNLRNKFFMTLYSDKIHGPHLASNEIILMFTDKIRKSIISSFSTLFQMAFKKIQNEPSLVFNESAIRKNKHSFLKNYNADNLKEEDYIPIIQAFRELEPECHQTFFYFIATIFEESINPNDKDDIEYVKVLYDAEIYEMDETFGELIEELEKAGLLQKTIIIVTADHGEEYFEHGHIGHGKTLYEEATHVPLIIFLPGNAKHLEFFEPVQSVDVMPTILDLLDIEIPDYARGISLVPLIQGNKQSLSDRCIYAEALRQKVSCRFKDWKYITDVDLIGENYLLNGKGEELYELSSDPEEKYNLIKLKPEIGKKLKEKIEAGYFKQRNNKKNMDYGKL